mmetsp:Transcript_16072/g.35278  ORF Transcript_16072/g.35278 Transcript_16072/m.35278 type:complete len:211 (-) Transcript_16072:176-808(-)
MPPPTRHEDCLAGALDTLDESKLLVFARLAKSRQHVEPPVGWRCAPALAAPGHRTDALPIFVRVPGGKERPPFQPTQQCIPCRCAGRVHVQVGTCPLDTHDDVTVQREERARVLGDVVQIVAEVGGHLKIVEQRRSRALQVALKNVEGKVSADRRSILHVEAERKLHFQRSSCSMRWVHLRNLERYGTIVLQHGLLGRPSLHGWPALSCP